MEQRSFISSWISKRTRFRYVLSISTHTILGMWQIFAWLVSWRFLLVFLPVFSHFSTLWSYLKLLFNKLLINQLIKANIRLACHPKWRGLLHPYYILSNNNQRDTVGCVRVARTANTHKTLRGIETKVRVQGTTPDTAINNGLSNCRVCPPPTPHNTKRPHDRKLTAVERRTGRAAVSNPRQTLCWRPERQTVGTRPETREQQEEIDILWRDRERERQRACSHTDAALTPLAPVLEEEGNHFFSADAILDRKRMADRTV